MILIQSFLDTWKRGFDYKGITTRRFYWYYMLADVIFNFSLNIIQSISQNIQILMLSGQGSSLNLLYYPFAIFSQTISLLILLKTLGTFVVDISLSVRRLRDIGKSWQWIFLLLIPVLGWIWFIWLMTRPSIAKLNNQDLIS